MNAVVNSLLRILELYQANMDFDCVRDACYHRSAGIFQANLLIDSSVTSSRCRRENGGYVDVPSLLAKVD